MDQGIQRAREGYNALERLAAKIPGLKGYIERETRREVDKMERDWIAARIDRARELMQQAIREWSRSGDLANLDLASSIDKALDRFANRVRHADYGFTGFFDAVKIYEDQLDRLYEYDLGLVEGVERIVTRIESLPGTAQVAALQAVLEDVREADRRFDERSTVFENVTSKGGR